MWRWAVDGPAGPLAVREGVVERMGRRTVVSSVWVSLPVGCQIGQKAVVGRGT